MWKGSEKVSLILLLISLIITAQKQMLLTNLKTYKNMISAHGFVERSILTRCTVLKKLYLNL